MSDLIDFGSFQQLEGAPPPRASAAHCVETTRPDVTYVFGGMGAREHFNDLYRFSLPSMQWSAAQGVAGRGPSPRAAAAMCMVRTADGTKRLAVFGGRCDSGVHGDLFTLDERLTAWQQHAPTGDRPCARDDAVAVSGAPDELGGCSMVLIGGTDARHRPLADVWIYHPTRGAWFAAKQSGSAPVDGIAGATAAKLGNDRVVVCAGFDARRFSNTLRVLDLRTFFWREI